MPDQGTEPVDPLEQKILRRIRQAANSQEAIHLARLLAELQNAKSDLERRKMEVETQLNPPSPDGARIPGTPLTMVGPGAQLRNKQPQSANRTSSRVIGGQVRQDWLSNRAREGYLLRQVRGKVLYETRSQRVVGIAVARELAPRLNKWFHGLPDEQVDVMVLLCVEASGQLAEFILPPDTVKGIWSKLSRSGTQVKINVKREASSFYLVVPGEKNLLLDPFRSKYDPLI